MRYFLEEITTIADAIGDVPNLSILKSVLEKTKLRFALGQRSVGQRYGFSQNGTFTVFAPSNAAFTKAQEEIPNTNANLKKLEKLLLRHVVEGKNITHDQFSADKKEFNTMNDADKVMIWKMDGKKVVGFKNVVAIDDHADIEVGNGVIHIISDVLVTKGDFQTILNETEGE